jgi:hypothetical protein
MLETRVTLHIISQNAIIFLRAVKLSNVMFLATYSEVPGSVPRTTRLSEK